MISSGDKVYKDPILYLTTSNCCYTQSTTHYTCPMCILRIVLTVFSPNFDLMIVSILLIVKEVLSLNLHDLCEMVLKLWLFHCD